jgi:hypothetical protein
VVGYAQFATALISFSIYHISLNNVPFFEKYIKKEHYSNFALLKLPNSSVIVPRHFLGKFGRCSILSFCDVCASYSENFVIKQIKTPSELISKDYEDLSKYVLSIKYKVGTFCNETVSRLMWKMTSLFL